MIHESMAWMYRGHLPECRTVVMVPFLKKPSPTTGFDEAEWMRKSIWKNDTRNKFIARLAKAVVTGDVEYLDGIINPQQMGASLQISRCRTCAVWVEGTWHAREIQRWLPWRIVAPKLEQEDRESWVQSPERHDILNTVAMERIGDQYDVTIRAGGTDEGVPRMSARERWLIDLFDNASTRMRLDSRGRMLNYRADLWECLDPRLPSEPPESPATKGNPEARRRRPAT